MNELEHEMSLESDGLGKGPVDIHKAYSTGQTQAEEIKYLVEKAASAHDGLAKYWYTCPDLQGLECSPNTHVTTRKDLHVWGQDPDNDLRVRWLLGDMGMGKTCLCRSTALGLESSGVPVAGYFLHGENRSFAFLLKAIAFGLSRWDHQYSAQVLPPDIPDAAMARAKFHAAILRRNLMKVPWKKNMRMVVIVDGVDLCSAKEDIEILREVVSEFSTPQVPIAWLISSRYTGVIDAAMSSLPHSSHPDFVIDLNNSAADSGIHEYTQSKLLQLFGEHRSHSDLVSPITKFLVQSAGDQFSLIETLVKNTSPSELLALSSGDSATLARVFKPIDEQYKSLLDMIPPLDPGIGAAYSLNDDKNSAFKNGTPSGLAEFIQQHALPIIFYHTLYLGLPNLLEAIKLFWDIQPFMLNQITEHLYPVFRLPYRSQSVVWVGGKGTMPVSINLPSFRTFLTTPERSGKHVVLRSHFDIVALRQCIRHINIDADILDKLRPQEMYHIWMRLAHEINERGSTTEEVREELKQALKILDRRAWKKICVRLGLEGPPEESDLVLQQILGRLYRIRATLRGTKGGGMLTALCQPTSIATQNNSGDPIAALFQAIPPRVLHDDAPLSECFEGTRKDILQDIESWSYDTTSQSRILWLTGSFRVGKSTIAMTLAFKLFDSGRLIGDFFFNKRHPGQSDAITGIAVALASRISFFSADARAYLSSTIRSDRSILVAPLDLQWRKLVLDTLTQVTERPSFRPLIIIDGLDGCNNIQDQLWLINKLVELCRAFPVAVVISSRPEWHLKQKFAELKSRNPTLFRTTIELGDSEEARSDMRKLLLRSTDIRRGLEENSDSDRREMEEAIDSYLKSVDGQYSVIRFIDPYLWIPFSLGKGIRGMATIPTDEGIDAAVYPELDTVYTDFMTSAYSTLTAQQVHTCHRLLFHLIHIRLESVGGLSAFWGFSPEEVHAALRPLHTVLRIPISDKHPITFYLSTFYKFLCSRLRGGPQGQFRLPWSHYCIEALEHSFSIARHYDQPTLPAGMVALWLAICPRVKVTFLKQDDATSMKRAIVALKGFDFSSWVRCWYLLQNEDLSDAYAAFRSWLNQISKVLIITKFRKNALSRHSGLLKQLLGLFLSFQASASN
ncbi:hypothetical protein AX16_003463 [Volvariella volvacea WC 439]|nr:hypothetical protein AX16_003463 [Volvariella volvacea WC 439]